MAIEKFRFVSPGVQVNEIDDSVIAPPLPAIGPVIIGRTAKGPFMQPVLVDSVGELEKIFGAPSNGIVGAGDIWRTDVPTAPTFATYAARAFLRNSSPVTVVRLGGVTKSSAESGNPGWSVDNAYHIYAVSHATQQATLAGIVYGKTGFALEVSSSVNGIKTNSSGTLTDNLVTLYLSTSAGGQEAVEVSLTDAGSSKFIRNVLNTNPTRYATDLYFLGETFENSVTGTYSNVFVSSSLSWVNFSSASYSAETPYITSDHTNTYSPKNLFKFVGLNSGGNLSKEIKISIENVRASKNTNVTKYGTFDVVIRKLFETQTSNVLERFNGVSLDATSEDYIAKRIGDTYRAWDNDNRKYIETGNYPNNSRYVRVEMYEGETISPVDLPHGFIVPGRPKGGANGFITGSAGTASHPNIQFLTASQTVSAAKATRFGLVSDISRNADLVDILRFKPAAASANSVADGLFTTRTIDTGSSQITYNSVNNAANYNPSDVLLNGSILGFNVPLYGGFDGVDITVKEPFVSETVLNNATETNSPAYRAIKQAIDIVSDPDLIDMNILCVPNLKKAALTSHMIDVCRDRGDAMAIIDIEGDYKFPFEATTNTSTGDKPIAVTSAITALDARQIDSSYGAAYFPAVFVASENIFMPASIAALGAFGGTEGRSALWFAPAGFNRGGLTEGSAGIGVSRTALSLNRTDRDDLYAANINPIATFPNEGVVIFGQKTLQQTPSALDRVNVRRLLNFIKKQISRAATRILFEPNVEDTWNNFKGVVEPFLQNIKNNFGLDDARVILDSSTTTADLVDRNTLYCKILLKPTRAIEFIAIDFVVTNSGASFSEQ